MLRGSRDTFSRIRRPADRRRASYFQFEGSQLTRRQIGSLQDALQCLCPVLVWRWCNLHAKYRCPLVETEGPLILDSPSALTTVFLPHSCCCRNLRMPLGTHD